MRLKVLIMAIFSVCFGNLICEEEEIYPKFTSSDREIIKSVIKDLNCKESENKIFTSNFDINEDGNIDVIVLKYKMDNIDFKSNCDVVIYFRNETNGLEKKGTFRALVAMEEDGSQEEIKLRREDGNIEVNTEDYSFFKSENKYSVYRIAKPTIIDTTENAYEDGIKRLKKMLSKAESGDIESQIKAGKKYQSEKKYDTALKWYQKALDSGYKQAAVYITGVYYDKEEILNYNKWVNREETKKSAENLRVEKDNLFTETNDETILVDYEAILKCKNNKVKQSIAYYYVVLKDYQKAKLWYKLVATNGMTGAMYNLGVLYEEEKKMDKALNWYKKSAEKGFIDSFFALGEIYYFGYGESIPKNYNEAIKWFKLGKKKYDVKCIGALGVAYFEGRGVKKDITEAKKLWKIAAEKGDLESKFDLETVEEYEANNISINYMAEKEGKYGIVNRNFEWIIKPKYSEPIFIINEKIVFNENNKYGIMDKNEKIIIKPSYDYISTIEDRFCFGVLNKKGEMMYGVKDYNEKTIINPKYDNVLYFENGLACVHINGKYGFIDKSGKTIIPAKYNDFSIFRNGVAVVSINNKYFAINEKGERIFKESYDYMGYFNYGCAVVKKENKYGLIDKKGKLVFPYQENEYFFYKDGIVIIIEDNKYIIKNIENKLIINEKYDLACFSIDDNIIVRKDESYGVLDKNGNYLMNLTNRFNWITVFVNGVSFAEESGGKSVYINKRGRVVFESLD